MSSISYPEFIQNNMQLLSVNVTFTQDQWLAITTQFSSKLNEAMTVGIIIGFVVAMVATYLARWWMERNDDTE